MAWWVAGAAVIGGALGNKSSKANRKAIKLQREMLAFYRGLWNDYKATYGDLEKQFVKESKIGLDPNFYADRAEADVRSAYGGQRKSYLRKLGRYGLDPTEGQYQFALSNLGNKEAATAAGQRTRTRMRVGDINFARKRSALNYGANLRNNLFAGLSGTGRNLAGGYGNQSSIYGQGAAGMLSSAVGLYGENKARAQKDPGLPDIPDRSSFWDDYSWSSQKSPFSRYGQQPSGGYYY